MQLHQLILWFWNYVINVVVNDSRQRYYRLSIESLLNLVTKTTSTLINDQLAADFTKIEEKVGRRVFFSFPRCSLNHESATMRNRFHSTNSIRCVVVFFVRFVFRFAWQNFIQMSHSSFCFAVECQHWAKVQKKHLSWISFPSFFVVLVAVWSGFAFREVEVAEMSQVFFAFSQLLV